VFSTVRLPSVTAVPDRDKLVTLFAGKRRRLFVGDDDEVFMTRSLDVTPKTTDQNLAVRSGKSEAVVGLHSTFCTVGANCTDRKHRAAVCYSRATCDA